MASLKTTNSVLTKLDKLEDLFRKKSAWVKGNYAETDDGEGLEEDQVKQKTATKWCLVGGAIKVGNGLQLFWELALTCDAEVASKVMNTVNELSALNSSYDKTYFEDQVDSAITGFNDSKRREHKEILKAIRDTRKRINKKGLTPLPKIAKVA